MRISSKLDEYEVLNFYIHSERAIITAIKRKYTQKQGQYLAFIYYYPKIEEGAVHQQSQICRGTLK